MEISAEGNTGSTVPAGAQAAAGRPLRIIQVISSLKMGGLEQFAVRLAGVQRAAGHDVRLFSFFPGELEAEAQRRGIPVYILPPGPAPLRAAMGAAHLTLSRPDVIHAHNPTVLHYAVLGRLLRRPRVVLTDHNQPTEVRRPSAREWKLTDAVVAVSGHTAEKAIARGTPGPIQVILNGVEPVRPRRSREEVRAELGFPPGAVLGVIVARMDRVKGYDLLLQALARLEPGSAPAIIALGDGPERAALERQAGELGLGPDRFRFLGFRSDTADLLAAGDFFVLPSRNEGLPLSVLEAMGQGLPVVVTPVGGIPEVVADGGQGLMVPVEDVEALAGALRTITADVALRERLGASALARARGEFSFDAMARQYERVYRGKAG